MKNPTTFYTQQSQKHQLEANDLKKKLFGLSTLRLIVFMVTAIAVYYTFSSWQIALMIAIIGVGIFLYLLSKYSDLKYKHDVSKALININEDEIKIASGDFHSRKEGLQYQNPIHFYSLDIDLFGRGSFFQFINRTTIQEGTNVLANQFTANHIKDIKLRQDAIKELGDKPKWRQHFTAIASLIKVETPALKIIDWLKNHNYFLPKIMQWLPFVFTMISALLLGLTIFKMLDPSYFGYWLLIGLGITAKYLKKINNVAQNTERVKDTFKQYSALLDLIENETFTSRLLQDKQKLIQSETKKASSIFNEFSKGLDALENRNNLISAIFGNGYFLSDIKNAYKIEQWIFKYAHKVDDWFEVVSFFDAYNSLGNFAFNHPQYVYPKITEHKAVIDAKDLGHPLLDSRKRIDSDLLINDQQFFIVTGANMAGKSTFLRTVSLHIVMANIGLPVCAKQSEYSPVKLITNMRTSDSLTDDSSYFFSELTRLKFIVDEIAKEPYFIVLDEILKGTNSIDKAIGSKKFVEKLVANKATGIIATHDLSLCEISKELKQVKNYYFDAEIVNDELFFDYKLKQGICKNMNASFLLKKMEIV
jgi:hypothetical protein